MDEMKKKQADQVVKTISEMLDDAEFHYEMSDEYEFHFSAKGDDLPMEIYVTVDGDRDVIRLLSILPFKFQPEYFETMAVGAITINDHLVNGNFDVNKEHSMISFRMVESYRDSLISKSVIEYMVMTSFHTLDEYNDKLLMLSKGKLEIDELAK